MNFTKMHGLGNDYVFVDVHDQHVDEPAALAVVISDRHKGVGSDGLILIGPSSSADVSMVIFNADGSRAEMCGNGIRCVAKYAVEHGLVAGPGLSIETDAGVKQAICRMADGVVRSVRIDMGIPDLRPSSLPATIEGDRIVDYELEVYGQIVLMTCVSMGNPHAVVFVGDPDEVDLPHAGPIIENAPQFPNKINVHFARPNSRNHLTMRSWERGSGVTRACGTGACAVCVAGAVTERTDRQVTATLPGGDLELDWNDDDHVYMTGPAVETFTGVWRG
ncbi:MAG: diaminopimelate epimerase [Planctomycetes bacterium]|nr:diaminopimelate epimerase [Planctomycetota bacterium]